MKLALVVLFPALLLAESPSHSNQTYTCDGGYSQRLCDEEMTAVRTLLNRYRADLVGHWTWVLVRSEDWKPLMYRLGMNPDSPALTDLSRRQTYFDEALFVKQAKRSAELLRYWQMPLDRLAEMAATHEIGHAMCSDRSEKKTHQRALLLQKGEIPSCESNGVRVAAAD